MRHRQPFEHGVPRRDVDQHAAVAAPVPPAAGHVGRRYAGHVGGLAVLHGQPVQVAAVLGHDVVDELRLPHRQEGVLGVQRGQAVEAGDDEERRAVRGFVNVVDVHLARGVGVDRDVDGVVAVMDLARRQVVLETPELVEGGEPEPPLAHAEPHAAAVGPFEYGDLPPAAETDEEQLRRLVGGEGERRAGLRHPGSELRAGVDLELRFCGAVPARFRGGGRVRIVPGALTGRIEIVHANLPPSFEIFCPSMTEGRSAAQFKTSPAAPEQAGSRGARSPSAGPQGMRPAQENGRRPQGTPPAPGCAKTGRQTISMPGLSESSLVGRSTRTPGPASTVAPSAEL